MKTIFEQLRYSLRFLGGEREARSYQGQKSMYEQRRAKQLITQMRAELKGRLYSSDEDSKKQMHQAINLIDQLDHAFIAGRQDKALDCLQLLAMHYTPKSPNDTKVNGSTIRKVSLPRLPSALREEVVADIKEMYACFDAGCYRASIILCGRLLEVSLYYLYFKHSGKDLLETAPGIGLGKMIAKLSELNVHLTPGLTEQVHLINKARIQSVHKKQNVFMPTKDQAEAMSLYTVDIIRKCFS